MVIWWHDLFSGGVIQRVRACVSMSLLPGGNKGLLCDNVSVLSPTQTLRHSGQSLTEVY